jgi:putative ABC transport system ATP-binding protein
MTEDGAFIIVRNIKRHFLLGDTIVRALDGVDLSVEQGEFLCLMGPSGSGKSTLLNLLGGLDTPDEGTIIVAGRDISTLDENELADYRQRSVGFVFQSFNLIPSMTALENVEFPMIFASISAAERRQRALEALNSVGLGDRIDHKPTELSGGQQQRVALARSLVNHPKILLCDEPTGNLDTKTGEEILEMLTALYKNGQTIIVVTHDPRLNAYATRSIHLLDGRVVSEERAAV